MKVRNGWYNYGIRLNRRKFRTFKSLHEDYLNTKYELISLKKEELKDFFIKKEFKGINVTIPYKKEVISYLDEVDPLVKRIGSCNCIINNNGKLKGYNTDYYGFKFLLEENEVSIENKNIAVLGSGGTYKTIKAVLEDLNANNIYCISRNKKDDNYTYEELLSLKVDIIINTTPIGMYPNNYVNNIDLDKIENLELVIDVIFNPLRTKLLIDAKRKNIKTIGGLQMLVAQGIKSRELFLNKNYTLEEIRSCYFDLWVDKSNIVLIGMPMSGKSTIGHKLKEAFNKEFIDIDKEIVDKENKTINEIFEIYGEDYFRKLENELYTEYSKKNGLIISTGGGIVKNIDSIYKLKQNGLVVFIDRKIEKMIINNHRPLSKTKEDIERLYKERYELYLNNSDVKINNNGSKKRAVINIVEAFYENISH